MRNPDSENIYEVISDKIVYIDLQIQFSFFFLFQLSFCYHHICSAIIDLQVNKLWFFNYNRNSMRDLLRISHLWKMNIKDLIWCFSTLCSSWDLIMKIYYQIDDLYSEIMRKMCRNPHDTCFCHNYIFWVFGNLILILCVECGKLKFNIFLLKLVESSFSGHFIIWLNDIYLQTESFGHSVNKVF